MSILDDILTTKVGEVALARKRFALDDLICEANLRPHPVDFSARIRNCDFPSIIAEIKRASPSKGIIRADLDPIKTAIAYKLAGAACISVLTDEQYFKGSLDFIPAIRAELIDIPILRKDFIIDPYQIWEARFVGADAILLIVAALEEDKLEALYKEAVSASLQVLIETHSQFEIDIVLKLMKKCVKRGDVIPMIGINNRDLRTFTTSLETTRVLCEYLFGALASYDLSWIRDSLIVVAESGIFSGSDVAKLARWGANAFLVGESLVRDGEPEENLSLLIGNARE